MEAKAIGRYLRVTPRKARFVLDAVRGKSVNDALGLLKFVPNEAAVFISKIVESAAANAEHNFAMDRSALRISTAFADQGPTMKRIHPRAMGRAYRILKRTSHITVIVTEDESLKAAVAKPKGRRVVGRGRGAAETAAPAAAKGRKTAPKPAEAKTNATPTAKGASAEAAPERNE